MGQLVGQHCTHCRERIASDLDGRYCEACGCPVHTACFPAAGSSVGADGCPSCHTAAAVLRDTADQRRAVLAELAARRKPPKAGGTCPTCGLLNPPSARQCDCGYDFVSQTQGRSGPRSGRTTPDGGSRVVGYGCLLLAPLLLLGGLITAAGDVNGALAGDAAALGGVCGSFVPALAALGVAVHLLRRR